MELRGWGMRYCPVAWVMKALDREQERLEREVGIDGRPSGTTSA